MPLEGLPAPLPMPDHGRMFVEFRHGITPISSATAKRGQCCIYNNKMHRQCAAQRSTQGAGCPNPSREEIFWRAASPSWPIKSFACA